MAFAPRTGNRLRPVHAAIRRGFGARLRPWRSSKPELDREGDAGRLIDRGNGVLALADALKIKLEQTGLVLEDVLGDLHRFVSAGRRLVLVDACREYYEAKRGGGSPASTLSDAFVAAMEKARGCAVLAGAAHGGHTYDDHERQNGVFTGALLDGLRGEAEGDDDALITLESLADFAHTRVRSWIEKHRNPPEDAVLGILARYDTLEMHGLPLAINTKKQVASYLLRRREALAHLLRQIDSSDELFRDADGALRVELPAPQHFELLAEIEEFADTPKLRRALRALVAEAQETHGSQAPAPSRAQSPGKPSIEKPHWADAVGKDDNGLWADLRIEKVVQRLRFIEPGEFWMGSPESETGRSLPTEAEWEYACRAGTETSTNAGELKFLGERNAPLLNGIAWYGGNSGVGYDLAEGLDSKGWKEKQYPHKKAGSRLVGEKAPNPWGLYDMMGNVWEWCEDAVEGGARYDSADAEDPVGTVGSDRVCRGGSWRDYAGYVRAAYRFWLEPGFRYDYLGFRFSLGQLRSGQGAERGT